MEYIYYIASYDDLIHYVLDNNLQIDELENFGKLRLKTEKRTVTYNSYVCAVGYNLLCDDFWDFKKNLLKEKLFAISWIFHGFKNGIKRNILQCTFKEAYEKLINKKKIELVFYGDSRSLITTYDSIYKNIYKPLHNMNFIICKSVHTYDMSCNNWKLINPHYVYITGDESKNTKYKNIEGINFKFCISLKMDVNYNVNLVENIFKTNMII